MKKLIFVLAVAVTTATAVAQDTTASRSEVLRRTDRALARMQGAQSDEVRAAIEALRVARTRYELNAGARADLENALRRAAITDSLAVARATALYSARAMTRSAFDREVGASRADSIIKARLELHQSTINSMRDTAQRQMAQSLYKLYEEAIAKAKSVNNDSLLAIIEEMRRGAQQGNPVFAEYFQERRRADSLERLSQTAQIHQALTASASNQDTARAAAAALEAMFEEHWRNARLRRWQSDTIARRAASVDEQRRSVAQLLEGNISTAPGELARNGTRLRRLHASRHAERSDGLDFQELSGRGCSRGRECRRKTRPQTRGYPPHNQ